METKDDTKIASPITFQPMPKRFMVWDKELNKFYEDSNGIIFGGGIGWLAEFLNNCGRPLELLEIVQSTNLFDKDGQEIFEGSIMAWGSDTGVVELYKGKWTFHVVSDHFDVYHELYPNADMVKAIGHILSNPELVEEK